MSRYWISWYSNKRGITLPEVEGMDFPCLEIFKDSLGYPVYVGVLDTSPDLPPDDVVRQHDPTYEGTRFCVSKPDGWVPSPRDLKEARGGND